MRFHLIRLMPSIAALLPAALIALPVQAAGLLRDLATACAKQGQTGIAALITAERFALSGRLDDAGIHAKHATGALPEGSGPWQRAEDVLIASERAAKRK